MKFRPLRAAVVAAAVLSAAWLALLGLATAAHAAQLEADFHLNGTRTAPTGETVADVGDGNAFAAESVDGGAARQVLTFPAGGGLSLPTTDLAGSGSYSVAILFRLDSSTTGRRKLMDFSGGTSDAGLYLCDGALVIELLAATPCPLGSGAGGGWAQVVLTRDDATNGVAAYLDGTGSTANDSLGALALGSELRLFLDDAVLPADEHSAGAIARLRVYDGALTATEVAALDRADQTPPQVALNSLPTPTTDATPAFSGTAGNDAGDLTTVSVKVYSGSSATGTPVRTVSATRDGASWTATLAGSLSDGTYTAQAEQADGAGNLGASEARTFTVDSAAPALSLTTPAAGATNDPTPTYSGAAGNAPGDSGSVTVRVYSGSSASGSPLQTLTATRTGGTWAVDGSPALADGTYTALAEQADGAGNTGTSAPRTFTVDTAAPAVTLQSPPAGAGNDSTPAYSGVAGNAAGDDGTVTVKIYSGSTASGSPVQTLTPTRSGASWSATGSPALADGTYTAQAEQGDTAGNTGTSEARTFTIDTATPAPTLQSPAAGRANDPTPTYGGTAGGAAGDSASVTVKVYSGSAASGSPVQTLTATRTGTTWTVTGSTPLNDGTYTATAEQTDGANNTGTSAPTTFTVDTASPSVSLTAPAATLINDRTPAYGGAAGQAAGDSTTVTVKIFAGSSATGDPAQTVTAIRSGGAWSQEGSPELPDGTYTARAEQADDAGNTGQSDTRTFTVDGAGPNVSLDTPTAGPTNDNTPTYSGTGGDAPGDSETVTVRVYSGSSASGTPVQTLDTPRAGGTWTKAGSPLSDGTYTAQAAQSDSANNVNVSQPRTFTVDTLRPDTTITSAPGDPTNDSTPAFTFSSDDAQGFVCRLYPADVASAPAFGGCSSPRDTGPLADGSYVFQVAAVDAAGNQDESPGSRTFRVDTTAPQVAFSVAPGDTIATDATFAFAAGEPASFTCRLDGGAWEPCGSPRSYSGLPLGPHALEVSASDEAGNQGAPARHAWQVLKPGETIPGASRQAVALAQDIVEIRRALRRVPLPRAARRGAISLTGIDALTPGTMRLVARARNRRFGVAKRTVSAAGTYRLRLGLTRSGRRLARRVPKLRVDLKLSFTDSLGRALQTSTTTTMFRRPPAR